MKKTRTAFRPYLHLLQQCLLIGMTITFSPGIACDTNVKELGPSGGSLAGPIFEPSGVENFTLSYSFRNDETDRELASQGIAGSLGSFQGTCGLSGANCVCDFYTDSSEDGENGSENTKVSSDDGATTYNSAGNIIYCSIPTSESNPENFTHMRIRDRSNTRVTDIVAITNQTQEEALGDAGAPLTIQDVLGDLQATRVRKIFEYRCFFNYLEKMGTTEAIFACNDGSLNILQIPYHFYLFSDNIQNNFGARIPDALHSDGSGTLCGAVIKSIDCTTSADGSTDPNQLTLSFGLFAENDGVFTKPVFLTNAPSRMRGTNTVFGFAAEIDPNGRCPPLFVQRESFSQQPADNGDTTTFVNTSVDADLVDTRILELDTVFDLVVTRYTGGTCAALEPPEPNRPNVCTSPNIDLDNGVSGTQFGSDRTYTTNDDAVCVIKPNALAHL